MNYNTMTLSMLRELAKEKHLKGISALKKQELIDLLAGLDAQSKDTDCPAPAPVNPATEKKPPVSRDTERTSPVNRDAERTSSANRDTERTSPANRDTREKPFRGNRDTSSRDNFAREITSRDDRNNTQYRNEERNNTSTRNDDRNNTQNRSDDRNNTQADDEKRDLSALDSGNKANGILEVLEDGFGFIRCENYLSGDNDVYVAPSQIRRFNLKTGDVIVGNIRQKRENEKFSALLFVESVNGYKPYEAQKRKNFQDLTPIFPDEKIKLETPGAPVSVRIMDILAPIGKGQRGMIVSQPKTGKTTLLKQIAKSIKINEPKMKIIILLIDERPEEVTDFKEYIEGPNVDVIYSTFDEEPLHHIRVAKMVLERARRLVEHGEDVVILLDSITRLARANNMVIDPSGRTLSGGLDPKALNFPKKFFGAARNMREGGSLTILATALVETGSKMDDVVFEEFKGTGNMEMILDRKLAERRIFPAINIQRSSTRRDDLLLTKEEQDLVYRMHRVMGNAARGEENVEEIWDLIKKTKNNQEFIEAMKVLMAKP